MARALSRHFNVEITRCLLKGMMRGVLVATAIGGLSLTYAASALGVATGSGASFPNRAYQQWCQDSGLCSYTSKGSSGGIRDFIAGTTDFGASDAPLTSSQLAQLRANRNGANVVYIPTLIGAITVPTNIDGVNGRLRLRGKTIAQIFSDQIVNWNDPRIRRDNRGKRLPNETITKCVRADGSGTSFAFSKALSKFDRNFARTVGASQTPKWPTANLQKGPKNPGVAACVNANSNSIGYVDIADSRAAGLLGKSAAVGKNTRIKGKRKLQFTTPSTRSTSKAGNVRIRRGQSLNVDLTGAASPGAYPLSTTTWILAYNNYARAGKGGSRADVIKMLNYFLGNRAQRALAKQQFAPLPENLRAEARRQVRTKIR